MRKVSRTSRQTLKYLLLASIVLLVSACSDAGTTAQVTNDHRVFRWKMVTAWPPNLPINHDIVVQFADDLKVMSNGRLDVQVFAGGELIPPLQAFDAVSQGSVEMGHTAAYYWAGKVPAAQFLSVVPFGMTQHSAWSWIYAGEGLSLWRELYAPFGVVPFPMGNSGIQMGGWFNKKIESVEDLKGLKMRIPGLGGKVLAKAGGNPVLLSAAEIYTALERGTIDATEWVGPLHDLRFGLDRAAKYYYYPGWHEPGSQLELIVNAEAWASLPGDLQRIIEAAAAKASLDMHARVQVENAAAFNGLVEKGSTEVLQFPQPVMRRLAELSEEVLNEEAAANEDFARLLTSYRAFRANQAAFEKITTEAYQNVLGPSP